MEEEYAVLSTPLAPSGKSSLNLPSRNDLFVYTAGRAMHFWPEYNGNNAVWLEEDIAPLFQDESAHKLTFVGTLVDCDHHIGGVHTPVVIGNTIAEQYIPGVGVDVLNKLDRRLLDHYEITPDEFASDGSYSRQSVEINCDRTRSRFIVLLNPSSRNLADQRIFNADEAAQLGIRRTSVADPLGQYYYEGKYKVLEAGVPRGVRGIAMLANPADVNAHIYDVAASDEGLSDVASSVADTDPYSLSNDAQAPLSDDSFAVINDGSESEVAAQGTQSKSRRELPLYESNDKLKAKHPHKGLIRTAVDTLKKKSYPSGVRAEAVKRVRAAHAQLNGDKHMTADELAAELKPLNDKIAERDAQIVTHTGEVTALTDRVKLKDDEIASQAAKIAEQADEIARLEDLIAAGKVAEIAKDRLTKLTEIDGFEVKDDEKAALIETIGKETDAEFRVRVLEAENAGLRAKAAAKPIKGDEQAAQTEDERAGLQNLAEVAGDKPKAKTYDDLYAKSK